MTVFYAITYIVYVIRQISATIRQYDHLLKNLITHQKFDVVIAHCRDGVRVSSVLRLQRTTHICTVELALRYDNGHLLCKTH